MLEKIFITQVDYSQNASRVNVLQFLELFIQTIPFNSIMNVNYD